MKVSEAAKLFLECHKAHSKENSVRAYNLVLNQLVQEFGTENLEGITTERILSFLTRGGMRISEVLKLTPSDINDRSRDNHSDFQDIGLHQNR